MSKSKGFLYHPMNGHPEQIYEGWSWPCFFFGAFWYIFKGIWIWAVIIILGSMVTVGWGWIIAIFIFPFFANGQHENHYLKKGYLSSPPDNS